MPPLIEYRPLTPKQRRVFVLVCLLVALFTLIACASRKTATQNADEKSVASPLPSEETLTIQRVTLDLTAACRVSAGVSQGNGRILVKFYGRDNLYVFDVDDRWLLAQREDRVALKPVRVDAAGRLIYKTEIEYVR